MSGPALTDDQRKLVNDHNLRVLIDQNVELRHCDTLSVGCIVAASASMGVFGTIVYNVLNKNITAGKSFLWSFFDWVFLPYFGVAIFMLLCGTFIRIVGNDTLDRIGRLYARVVSDNQLPTDVLVPIQDQNKRNKSSHSRQLLSSFVFWIGIGLSIILFMARGVEMFVPHVTQG